MQYKGDEEDNNAGLLGKQVHSRREVNIRSHNYFDDLMLASSEARDPWITGCAVIPNGNVVICDRNNEKLKLFDNDWVCQESLSIPDINRVSVFDPNTVIVTVTSKTKLQCLRLVPHLQLGRTIKLDSECWGVHVSGSDIYLTCKTSKGSEIRVLDLDGSYKCRVPIDNNSSPLDITLSPSGEKIFFTELNTQVVTCMTVDGGIVYQYRDENLKDAKGMYCDLEHNLFVVGRQSNNVHAITADGKSCGTLLTSRDGLVRPQCIAYRHSDNVLIIGCSGLDHLLVSNWQTNSDV